MQVMCNWKYAHQKLGFLYAQPKPDKMINSWITRAIGIQNRRWFFGVLSFRGWEEVQLPPSQRDIPAKCIEIVEALARRCAERKPITFEPDWGYGSGTLIDPMTDEHTHFGSDCGDDEDEQFKAFMVSLHHQLCGGSGLSWEKAADEEVHEKAGDMDATR